jgi:hypothetical protein
MKACGLCKFFTGGGDTGVCNRYPPVVIDPINNRGRFVPVENSWWCGEFVDAERNDYVTRRYDAAGSSLVDAFTEAQYGGGYG